MKRRALLIGIDEYQLLQPLKYARRDAELFGNILQRHCQFEADDISLMTCQSRRGLFADAAFIEHALINLQQETELDLLIVGFWGHGFSTETGQRFLCGVNTLENDLKRTAISLNVVKEKLSQIQACDTLVFLDCCQNRPAIAGRGGSAEMLSDQDEAAFGIMSRDIKAARRTQDFDRAPRFALLSACRAGQKAYEWEERDHGIFTAHLTDGLRSGLTSINQLNEYVVDHVPRTASKYYQQRQVPFLETMGGDIILGSGSPLQVPPKAAPSDFKGITIPPVQSVSSPSQKTPGLPEKPRPGTQYTFDLGHGLGLDLTYVPGGNFRMGNRLRPDEIVRHWGGKVEWYSNADPIHEVILPGFWTGSYAVTNVQFMRYVTETGQEPEDGAHGWDIEKNEWAYMPDLSWNRTQWPWRDDNPVVCVSWNDAQGFCKWLKQKTGLPWSLPAESQWEYACRGGTDTVFFWGDDPAGGDGYLNAADEMGAPGGAAWDAPFPFKSRYQWVAPVGSCKPNSFGLHDMLGNVLEWCQDDWHDDYRGGPSDGSAWAGGSGSFRVCRGGSWSDSPRDCRCAIRGRLEPGSRGDDLGFRVVLPSVPDSSQPD